MNSLIWNEPIGSESGESLANNKVDEMSSENRLAQMNNNDSDGGSIKLYLDEHTFCSFILVILEKQKQKATRTLAMSSWPATCIKWPSCHRTSQESPRKATWSSTPVSNAETWAASITYPISSTTFSFDRTRATLDFAFGSTSRSKTSNRNKYIDNNRIKIKI